MNIVNFKTSLNHVERLLKAIGVLRQKGVKSINDDGVSEEFKRASLRSNYFAAYNIALEKFDYDYLLQDQSFFQFQFNPSSNLDGFPNIRYAFFQNPQEFRTYKDFLIESELLEEDEAEIEIGDSFQDLYEQYLIEQQLNLKSCSIRFDVDFSNYRPLIHSVAHLHIGHSNDIRIPCDKLLTPEKFVLFVLKQTYYSQWRELIENSNLTILDCLDSSKDKCFPLEHGKWNETEKKELFIT